MSSFTKDHINTQAICLSVDGAACSSSDPAESRALIAEPLKPNVMAIDIPEQTVALSTPTMSLMWEKGEKRHFVICLSKMKQDENKGY